MNARPPSTPPDIPGFRYLDFIGSGGFSDVFKYEQLGLNRTVAVKVLLRDLGEAAQKSFEAEANLMAKLSNHPAIVSIYHAGQAPDGRPYLVMEYCPPPHLASRISAGALSLKSSLVTSVQIAAAVEMAHRLGVLHRDIKPANILFTEYDLPALTDFGISVTTEGASQGQGVGMSVPWAPPEQLTTGQQMGPASDVYSLAATLWTMLTGHSPFELVDGPNDPYAMSKRVKTQPVPPLNCPGAPRSLELVLKTALNKDPSLRYGSALDFARALQSVQSELLQSVTPTNIRDDAAVSYQTSGREDTGTQVVSPISINPEVNQTDHADYSYPSGLTKQDPSWSSRLTPGQFISHGRGSAPAQPAREFTSMELGPTPAAVEPSSADPNPPQTAGASDPSQAEPAGPTTGGRRSGLFLGLLIGALLVGGGTYFGYQALSAAPQAAQQQSAEPSSSVRPKDPIGEQVPMPTDLKLELIGDQVSVTWQNPSPQEGDSYLWTLLDPSQEPIAAPTQQTSVQVSALPGRTCVQVQLVRANGRYSEPQKGCTE